MFKLFPSWCSITFDLFSIYPELVLEQIEHVRVSRSQASVYQPKTTRYQSIRSCKVTTAYGNKLRKIGGHLWKTCLENTASGRSIRPLNSGYFEIKDRIVSIETVYFTWHLNICIWWECTHPTLLNYLKHRY